MRTHSATLPLDEYEQEEFASSATYTGPAGRRGTASVGLSPFQIPEGVDLELRADGSCSFRFRYANDEAPQKQPHQSADDPDIHVVVGRHSGKILEVRVLDSLRYFREGASQFRLSPKASWYPSLAQPAQLVAARNASLIERILNYAVAHLRARVLEAAASIVTATPAAT